MPAGATHSSQSLKNIKLSAKSIALEKTGEIKGGFIEVAAGATKAKHHDETLKKGAYSSEIRVQGKRNPHRELTNDRLYYPVSLLPKEKGKRKKEKGKRKKEKGKRKKEKGKRKKEKGKRKKEKGKRKKEKGKRKKEK